MFVNTNYNINSFGRKWLTIKQPVHPNSIKRIKPAVKPKTVVVLPDGTIDKSPFAKILQRIEDGIGQAIIFMSKK